MQTREIFRSLVRFDGYGYRNADYFFNFMIHLSYVRELMLTEMLFGGNNCWEILRKIRVLECIFRSVCRRENNWNRAFF